MKRQHDKLHGLAIGAWLAITLMVAGCASTQRISYQAVGTAGVTANAAMNAWADYCKTGKADADEVKTVEGVYRTYVIAYNLVIDIGKATVGSNDTTELQAAMKAMAACEANLVQLVLKLLPSDLSAKLEGK